MPANQTPTWEYESDIHLLAISPHLDDAVLSIGAMLKEATSKATATVFTVFAGDPETPFSPIARKVHEVWNLTETPVQSRRAEDRNALALVGAEAVHGDFLDFLYREYWETADTYALKSIDTDLKLVSRLSETVRELITSTRPDVVLTCAAVGDHTDHRHTRDAVLACHSSTEVPILLWEDLPYGIRASNPAGLPPGVSLAGKVVAHSDPSCWNTKYEAVECYESQQSMLWNGADFRKILNEHAESRADTNNHEGRVEALWKVA